jgi:YhcH/YjgK/YiaL family protein
MILDQFSNASFYRNLGPRFAAGFDYLAKTNLEALADGRHEIRDDELYVNVHTYRTKPPAECRWEAHRHRADIQYIVRGREKIGVAPLGAMKLVSPYNPVNDVEFYEGDGQFIEVRQGDFAIFLPHDAHMPTVAIDGAAEVKKVVVKVFVR